MGELRFATLTANDLLAMNLLRQSSQQVTLGVHQEYGLEEAEQLASQPCAWSVRRAGELIACFGIFEEFRGVHGTGWAMLTPAVGASHLELTRFIRSEAEHCGLPRLQLLARVPEIEDILASRPDLDAGQVAEMVKLRTSAEYRWAVLLGFRPMHLLRFYGATGDSYMLFERINPAAAVAMRRAA